MAEYTSYYKLKPQWALRGWEGSPHLLVNTADGRVAHLDDATFFAASACDGQTDLDLPIFRKIHRQARDRLFDDGFIERLAAPSPVSEFQRYRKAPNPYHKSLLWSVTGACNLKCRHCYLHAPDAKYRDLGFQQIVRLVDEMVVAGIMDVCITGGEPFVRKDVWDIFALLKDAGIGISQIYTNGVLLTDAMLDRLAAVLGDRNADQGRKTELCLSFDGVGSHDDIRGVEGTEQKTVAAIERIRAHGFPVLIETALYRNNVSTMAETLDLMAQKGVQSWKISGVGDVGKWVETGGAETLPVHELFDCYLDLLDRFIVAGKPLTVQVGGFWTYHKHPGRFSLPLCGSESPSDDSFLKRYACNSCRFIRYLLSDGTLLPCMPMTGTEVHGRMPNVAAMGLSKALKASNLWEIVSIRVGDLVARNRECAECDHLGKCTMGCRACALIYGDGVFARDPITCRYWKGGYPERIAERIGASGE